MFSRFEQESDKKMKISEFPNSLWLYTAWGTFIQLEVEEFHRTGNSNKVLDSDDGKIKSTKGSFGEIPVFWISRISKNLV